MRLYCILRSFGVIKLVQILTQLIQFWQEHIQKKKCTQVEAHHFCHEITLHQHRKQLVRLQLQINHSSLDSTIVSYIPKHVESSPTCVAKYYTAVWGININEPGKGSHPFRQKEACTQQKSLSGHFDSSLDTYHHCCLVWFQLVKILETVWQDLNLVTFIKIVKSNPRKHFLLI